MRLSSETPIENRKVPTGITGFDEVSLGGLAEGQAALISGTSGSGKTIFGAQYLYEGALQFNQNGVFVTFEENPRDLKHNLLQLGWNFNELEEQKKVCFVDASLSPTEESKVLGNYELDGLKSRIEHAINKVGAKRIVLDSIGSIFFQLQDSTVIRNELYRILSFIKQKELTVIITSERFDDYGPISRFGVEEYIVDHVILLRNILEKDKRRRSLEILKYRGSNHKRGEQPFIIIENKGIVVLPLSTLELKQNTSAQRVSSGVQKLDSMCGGGFFRDSVVLVSGATGTGKTLIVSEFIKGGYQSREKVMLFAYEEGEDQLIRNAKAWGIDFTAMQNEHRLKIVANYPETLNLEEHLYKIMQCVETYQPNRIAIDSLSAIERVSTPGGFRAFIISLTCYLKKKEITTLLTSTSTKIFGDNSVTQSHISTITDSIILLRYAELKGKIFRVLTILKMRGSDHDKSIYEYNIDRNGMQIMDKFENVSGILGGSAGSEN